MIHKKYIISIFFIFLALAIPPFRTTYGTGGRIEGKVMDAKGAAIIAATIAARGEVSKNSFTTETDSNGRFKLEGLPPDIYTVVVTAKGFAEYRNASVKVTESDVVSLEIRLEVAPVEANVTVETPGTRANSDPIYQLLRRQGKAPQDFGGAYAAVSELKLQKEGALFVLHSGEIYFLNAVEGRVTGAVFIGDGEVSLVPPTEVEKASLKIFTDEPSLNEKFTSLVLRFTDKTFEEVASSPATKMGTGGPQSARARDLYGDNQQLLRKRLRDNRELRTLADIYAPARPGFFNAFIDGRRYNKLIYIFDPMGIPEVAPEEIA
ncbi:MAG TPA: carboxypeptidase-like regulatory domain-containing protein [Pyrinomonadaceae bacterium]|nr:carboxypeptidase-like regulatory domain-containing protein [Pyrinomonadaceae bacterium]